MPADEEPKGLALRRSIARWRRPASAEGGFRFDDQYVTAGGASPFPILVFGTVEIFAAFGILHIARHMWFYHDEWDFLASRQAGNINDLFRPHNEHWSTIPILVYRGLWQAFGLRHYFPYLFVDVLGHLVLAAILLAIMRRCGVRPWVAIAPASLFVLFGSGYQDLARAFQMTFVWTLVFGFTQLLCADHEGGIDRRDWAGLGAGVAGLMSSGLAIPMVVVVGVAVLLRRGIRAGLFHVGPLIVGYAVWYQQIGRDANASPNTSVTGVLHFAVTGVVATFEHLGQKRVVAVMLGLLLLVGSAAGRGTALSASGRHRRRRRYRLRVSPDSSHF